MSNNIRPADIADLKGIKALYLDIAERYPDNLSPFSNEVTDEFILDGLTNSLERGAAIVMENENKEIIAYGKGYTSTNVRKAHIFDNTTVIIRSDYMNSMVAYRFCKALTDYVKNTMPYIKYTRSTPHANNTRSLRALQSIGMKQISTQPNAIICKDGSFMDEVTLIWENPNFSYTSLVFYHQYLVSRYSSSYKLKDTKSRATFLNTSTKSVAISV